MSDPIPETVRAARRKIAEDYVRKQLAIMDGSVDAAILRIGTERFEKLVDDIEKALPRRDV